jgi:flagellar motility protein MotE (MotC chaperone)
MLRSPFILALLGIVLGIGTTAGVIIMNKDLLISAEPKAPETKLPMPANAPRDWVFWTEEINKLSTDLKEEREALDVRQKQLDDFEKRLAGEREELSKVRAELDSMRREVTDNIPKIEASEKANIKNLAKTYTAMKPADAVAVMRELDDQSVVKILASMKADVVGTIFQEMAKAKDADGTLAARAARISEQLRLVQNETKTTAQQ